MDKHHKVNYFEFPAQDIAATKTFFSDVFGWGFTDYGEQYVAITGAGLDGGFFASDQRSSTEQGSVLIVLYSEQLEQTASRVTENGGKIVKPVFSFPGGRRFHFTDPSGNEFAVWSDK